MGNKTKYSKAIVTTICRYISDGLNNKQACQAAGICETTLSAWRREHPDFAERVEAAREVMRAKVLAQIKAAGAKDWRAHAEFLRLAFAGYRFANSPQVNVAIQQNTMQLTDPERAELIAKLEKARAKALADKSGASEPLQLEDAKDSRAIAEEAERALQEGAEKPAKPLTLPKPKPLKMTLVETADDQMRRMRAEGWRSADCVDGINELLD